MLKSEPKLNFQSFSDICFPSLPILLVQHGANFQRMFYEYRTIKSNISRLVWMRKLLLIINYKSSLLGCNSLAIQKYSSLFCHLAKLFPFCLKRHETFNVLRNHSIHSLYQKRKSDFVSTCAIQVITASFSFWGWTVESYLDSADISL